MYVWVFFGYMSIFCYLCRLFRIFIIVSVMRREKGLCLVIGKDENVLEVGIFVFNIKKYKEYYRIVINLFFYVKK